MYNFDFKPRMIYDAHFGFGDSVLIRHTAIFSVVIFTTASRDEILRRSPNVEFTSDSCTRLRDVIWIKYISTTTEEM